MKNTTLGKFVSMTVACLFAATAECAETAVWQGGATGDINNPDNWNSGVNIATDWLNFGQDVTVTMSQDTEAYDPFGNKKSSDSAFMNKTIVFNLGGHTLWTTAADPAGKQYIRGNFGTTYVFTNGVFHCTDPDAHSKTNGIYTSASNASTNMSIVAIGDDTTIVSSFALGYAHRIGLHVLNGAKAYGTVIGLGCSSEVFGGNAEMRFSNTCHVGPRESSLYAEASNPPHGVRLLVDDATLTAENPALKGTLYAGYGNYSYGNSIVATNGATVVAKTIIVGYGGINGDVAYTSSNNTFKATGTGTTVSLPTDSTGNGSITCGIYSSGNMFLIENGASVTTRNATVGSGNVGYTTANNTLKVTGAGTVFSAANGTLTCGDCSKGGSFGNQVIVENGASVTANKLYVGTGAATNNVFRASGAGTTANARFIIGGESDASTNSFGNSCIFENGMSVTAPYFWVNTFGSNNAISVRSGTTATVSSDIYLGGRSMKNNPADGGANGRLEVVGEGTSLTCGNNFSIRNSTGDAGKGQELFIGGGASVSHTSNNGFIFYGDGNRVVLSNGTLTVKTLFVNGSAGSDTVYPATNTTFRIEGANASLTANVTKDITGTDKQLVGAPIFEFKIPEGGWASAPVAINQAFTLGDDAVIGIDRASARAFARAGGGTVPLISTGTSGKEITADIGKLTASADLPDGCTLQNEGGVLSVKVTQVGMTIFVR